MYTIVKPSRNELFALETDRLRLSVLRKSSFSLVASYLRRNRSFHKKFAQTHSDSYFTDKTQKLYMKADELAFRRDEAFPLYIFIKNDTSKVIGKVSFFNFAMGGMMSCTLGYHLDNDYTGKGYMTEGIKESILFLVKELKIHRIEAFILANNAPSLKLIRNLGFKYEGTKHSFMHIDGSYKDHESFYLLDEDILKLYDKEAHS